MDFIDEIIDKTFSSRYPYKLVSVVSKIASPKGEIPLHGTGNVFFDVPGNKNKIHTTEPQQQY